MWSIISSLIGSFILFLVLLIYYIRSGGKYKRNRLFARDLWWLPSWKCWRFVIRNIEGDCSLHALKFRAWFREIEPSNPGCSVDTYIDNILEEGGRLLLPKTQDLPVLCFRFESNGETFEFLQTDKLGNEKRRFELKPDKNYEIIAEYSFNIRSWNYLPYFITRLLSIPQFVIYQDEEVNLFKALKNKQGDREINIAMTFTEDEIITVPLP